MSSISVSRCQDQILDKFDVSTDRLNHFFPFFIHIDHQLNIQEIGHLLKKAYPEVKVGQKLSDYFKIFRPKIEISSAEFQAHKNDIITMQALEKDILKLQGELLRCDKTSTYLFICSPLFTASSQVIGLNLSMADLPAFDASINNVFLLQTQRQVIAENLELIHTLQKSEKGLVDLNRVLDQKVEKRTRELNELVKQKEVLLREVHHRVKNNLQIIAALVHIQGEKIKDSDSQAVMESIQNQIQSMALLHTCLFNNGVTSQVNIASYATELVDHLKMVILGEDSRIQVQADIQSLWLDLDTCTSVGLIINELVTNAMKYAFDEGASGLIKVQLTKQSATLLRLVIQDNGKGMPDDVNFENLSSLGILLVKDLSKKLKGTLHLDWSCGTTFTIDFPIKKLR